MLANKPLDYSVVCLRTPQLGLIEFEPPLSADLYEPILKHLGCSLDMPSFVDTFNEDVKFIAYKTEQLLTDKRLLEAACGIIKCLEDNVVMAELACMTVNRAV